MKWNENKHLIGVIAAIVGAAFGIKYGNDIVLKICTIVSCIYCFHHVDFTMTLTTRVSLRSIMIAGTLLIQRFVSGIWGAEKEIIVWIVADIICGILALITFISAKTPDEY